MADRDAWGGHRWQSSDSDPLAQRCIGCGATRTELIYLAERDCAWNAYRHGHRCPHGQIYPRYCIGCGGEPRGARERRKQQDQARRDVTPDA